MTVDLHDSWQLCWFRFRLTIQPDQPDLSEPKSARGSGSVVSGRAGGVADKAMGFVKESSVPAFFLDDLQLMQKQIRCMDRTIISQYAVFQQTQR